MKKGPTAVGPMVACVSHYNILRHCRMRYYAVAGSRLETWRGRTPHHHRHRVSDHYFREEEKEEEGVQRWSSFFFWAAAKVGGI